MSNAVPSIIPLRSKPPPIPEDARRPLPQQLTAPDAPQPEKRKKRRLGDILLDAGVVDEAAIDRALGVQKMGGGRLGSILVKLRLCTDEQIRAALEQQMGVEVMALDGFVPDEAVINLIPREMVRKYEAIPVKKEGETLYVAMLDPYNLTALDDIRFCTGARRLVVMTCTESGFRSFVEEHLETQCLIEEILEGGNFYDQAVSSIEGEAAMGATDEESEIVHDLKLAGSQPPVITLCNFLLVESINRGASDIHVEPYETYFRVRLRIDGRLQTLLTPPQRLHSPMITRFKVMAEMDIAKRRVPQDGHIAIVFNGETCHYRVSTLPTVYGEKCVIRLLKKNKALTALETLGFDEAEAEVLKKSLASPQGIILVTGPTGSGKTTTLHAGLGHINDPEVNIVTLEDPVEASIPGINHVQINPTGGVTFSSGLRSILRQDPDVVFVGEMRDTEVSAIAVKAALTGHLVLSTLHTNSAAESLVRLGDMGVKPYLLANALLLVVAQRLVRKVCDGCFEFVELTDKQIAEFRISEDQQARAKLRRGQGCSACYDTGYRGRIAVYELLKISNELRTAIRRGAPVEELIELAEGQGLRLLFDAGVEKAIQGMTTLDEVRRGLVDAR